MGDYPQAAARRCYDEEHRAKRYLPEQIWRVELRLSQRCAGFLSRRKYSSFEAANRAANRFDKRIAELTGDKDD